MKTSYQNLGSRPNAWIAVDGGRKKIYNDKFVYLKDGQSFEIEFSNPTRTTYLAKIKLNGKDTSSSGLVLRPGEKYFIKRYLDSDNAYVFRTYDVEANNQEVDFAIAENGLLTVEFYAEDVPLQTYTFNNFQYPNNWQYINYYNTVVGSSTANNLYNCSFTTNASSSESKSLSEDSFKDYSPEEKKETGMVEMGHTTGQSFTHVNKNFSAWCSYITEYQIFPESQKPIVKEDIKIYCTSCGKKCKHKDNFCPKCGTQLIKN